MKIFISTIAICYFVSMVTLKADNLRTLLVTFEDKDNPNLTLEVKCIVSKSKTLDFIKNLDERGFALSSFASINDAENYIPDQYTYRFMVVSTGVWKNGKIFSDESGGFATSIQEAIEAAKNKYIKLESEVLNKGSVSLDRIIIIHEKITK